MISSGKLAKTRREGRFFTCKDLLKQEAYLLIFLFRINVL